MPLIIETVRSMHMLIWAVQQHGVTAFIMRMAFCFFQFANQFTHAWIAVPGMSMCLAFFHPADQLRKIAFIRMFMLQITVENQCITIIRMNVTVRFLQSTDWFLIQIINR